MSKPEWTDATGYSRGEKERRQTAWTLVLSRDIRVTVMRNHRYYPDGWCFTASPFCDTRELPDLMPDAIEAAQRAALAFVVAKLEETLAVGRDVLEGSDNDQH